MPRSPPNNRPTTLGTACSGKEKPWEASLGVAGCAAVAVGVAGASAPPGAASPSDMDATDGLSKELRALCSEETSPARYCAADGVSPCRADWRLAGPTERPIEKAAMGAVTAASSVSNARRRAWSVRGRTRRSPSVLPESPSAGPLAGRTWPLPLLLPESALVAVACSSATVAAAASMALRTSCSARSANERPWGSSDSLWDSCVAWGSWRLRSVSVLSNTEMWEFSSRRLSCSPCRVARQLLSCVLAKAMLSSQVCR
mmetsp:Transcript_1055/g.3224  ORF Transcript_1055/g.3224 Transcript_1055/m.3224 type:complete len:258 (+) Transcript_1055:498-1271(+)